MFLISCLQETVRSAKHFINYFEEATFSKFIITSLSSITDSQFSMNWDIMSMISCIKSWIFCYCHFFVRIVINLKAYCLERFLNLGYILQILLKNSLRLASSKVSDGFLHILIILFKANSCIWSAEYLLILVC